MPRKIRILLVSAWPPTEFHAGGQRQLDIYSYLKRSGNYELFLYSRKVPEFENHIQIEKLKDIFDGIYWTQNSKLSGVDIALSSSKRFDIVDLQHLESANEIETFRHIGQKILFTPMESELRNLAIAFKNLKVTKTRIKLALLEIRVMSKSDLVVSVSKSDESYLKLFSRRKTSSVETPIPSNFLKRAETSKNVKFESRRGIVFVAYFGSRTNIDALNWYISQVHMPLLSEAPDINLIVVGDKSKELGKTYSSSNIQFVGRVRSVIPYIANARIAIAPALNGSGFRGKINQYSILKIPTIAHPLSVRGLDYPAGSIAVCANPKAWIKAIKELYYDGEKSELMATSAFQHAQLFRMESQQEKLFWIYNVE